MASSWTKLFSIDGRMEYIVGFSKSGKLVLVGNGRWVLFPIMETPKVLNFASLGPVLGWHVESYMESLVMLQDGDDLPLSPLKDANVKKVGSKRSRDQGVH